MCHDLGRGPGDLQGRRELGRSSDAARSPVFFAGEHVRVTIHVPKVLASTEST